MFTGLGRQDTDSEYLVTENKDLKKEQKKEEKTFAHFYSPSKVAKPEVPSSVHNPSKVAKPEAPSSVYQAPARTAGRPSSGPKIDSHSFLPTPSSRPRGFDSQGQEKRRSSAAKAREPIAAKPPGGAGGHSAKNRNRSQGFPGRYRTNSVQEKDDEAEPAEEDEEEEEEEDAPKQEEDDDEPVADGDTAYDYEDEDNDVKNDAGAEADKTTKKTTNSSPEYYYYYYYDDVNSGIDIRDVAIVTR